jgi:uncharacterized protein
LSYLIDGHNLIPKISGMSLRAIDDELELIERLQAFCRSEKRSVEVFFDKAPPGRGGTRRYGRVTAHFIREGLTADSAISARLKRLKKGAANWTVVSSDRQVQAEARSVKAKIISSEEFAVQMETAAAKTGDVEPGKEKPLSQAEIDEWLRIFGSGKDKK